MRLPLPNPAALMDAAVTAMELVPRAATTLDRVDALLDRMESLTDRADAVLTHSEAVLKRSDTVATRAGRAVDGVMGVTDRVDASLTPWEPLLRALQPKAKRFADDLSEAEVSAAITLIDRMPTLLEHVENDVLPVLKNLDRVGPDLHEVLEVVEDLRRVITGLPGVGFLRRRADDEPPQVEGSIHD